MSLIAGITSGMWIWSGKTLESWRKFYESCRCDNPPKEEPQLVNKGKPDSRCDYDVIGIEGHDLYDTGKACHPNSLEWNQVIAVDAKRARMNEYVIMPGPRYPGEVPVSREGKPHVREYRGRLASSERFGWSGASDVRDFPLLNSDVISSDVACGDVRAERTSSGVPTLPVRVKSKKTKIRHTRNGVE
uniref:Frizzled/Smoothened 7TM domain-containing protein n=1 Tax=Ciona savignyi TaxID=51511 RepID=H2YBE6_CIOSA